MASSDGPVLDDDGVHAWEQSASASANEIVPKLFVGDRVAALYPPPSVSHVVNITQRLPCSHGGRLRYLHIDLDDNDNAPIHKHFHESNKFIEEGRKADGVLVHCQSGMSRSVTLVIAYLISNGQTLANAYELVRSKRPGILPNRGFFVRLQSHERALDHAVSMTTEDADVERLVHPFMAHPRERARAVLREHGGNYHKALEQLCEQREQCET